MNREAPADLTIFRSTPGARAIERTTQRDPFSEPACGAQALSRARWRAMNSPFPPGNVILIKGSDVAPKAIAWLWPGYLARGKVHINSGKPGAGKTTVALSLAAAFSRGSKLPDGSVAQVCKVLIWSGEDDIPDTIVPRLAVMGANSENFIFIGGTGNRPFNPATDMDALSKTLETVPGVGLVIVDPIVSVIGGNANIIGDARKGLQPLVDLAIKFHLAVVGIHHFTKGTVGNDPVERVSGSLGIAAVARILFVTAKREDGATGGSRMFARAKSNIGPDGGGFAFDLSQRVWPNDVAISASAVEWGIELEGSAKELLADAEKIEKEETDDNKLRAVSFKLSTKLAKGPVSSVEVRNWAKSEGISDYALRAAKKELKVTADKDGLGAWFWRLPGPVAPPSGVWFTASA
jgi:putative DNA primase/helicase